MSAIAVIFGGPSPEHDVSILTGLQASRALIETNREVISIYWSKNNEWFQVEPSLEASAFLDGVPQKAVPLRLGTSPQGGFRTIKSSFGREKVLDIEASLICCHGGPGEDGTLQGALDLAGMYYSGPTVASAGIGMDKLGFSSLISSAGLTCLPRVLLTQDTKVDFSPPFILKPRFGGSSIGIEVVEDLQTAQALVASSKHMLKGAVLEPYRSDLFDLNIAVKTWPVMELSAIERPLKSGGTSSILGYKDKYVGDQGMVSAPRELPAKIDKSLEDHLRQLALEVAEITGIRGIARIDFLSDGSEVFINEINTIPGSLAKYLWVDPVISFDSLLKDMIDEAIKKPAKNYTTLGSDGTILRSASSIAAKLG